MCLCVCVCAGGRARVRAHVHVCACVRACLCARACACVRVQRFRRLFGKAAFPYLPKTFVLPADRAEVIYIYIYTALAEVWALTEAPPPMDQLQL